MALSRVSRELVLINSRWLQPADQRKLSERGFSPIYSFSAQLCFTGFHALFLLFPKIQFLNSFSFTFFNIKGINAISRVHNFPFFLRISNYLLKLFKIIINRTKEINFYIKKTDHFN
jgi:hypothetical protein